MKKSLTAVVTVASFGGLVGQASAESDPSVCGSVSITVNGQALVDEQQCLPPEGQ